MTETTSCCSDLYLKQQRVQWNNLGTLVVVQQVAVDWVVEMILQFVPQRTGSQWSKSKGQEMRVKEDQEH